MKLLFQVLPAEVTPVIKLDGEPVNDGKVTQLHVNYKKDLKSI